MKIISNPILKGFNPDPSIIRVGDDYYIATSTFEWFPGVQIHHSKDLINWELVARPLNRISQLDMRGVPSSCGVWAPCLSYCDGLFYLIYTIVTNKSFFFKDTHNYLVTAKDICGDWTEPVYLNSSGFDPSLFHDDDGRKWLVNMLNGSGMGKNSRAFAGIVMQEYSDNEKKLIGPSKLIFEGSSLRVTEGPHLYKRNGYYYLLTAEGGTGFGHAVTLARSKDIWGPYELHPENPILTSRYDTTLTLQKARNADLVETQNKEWFMVHLTSRPIQNRGQSVLGRETAIQRVVWCEDGWLRLEGGGNTPKVEIPAPSLQEHSIPSIHARDDFDSSTLNIHFQSLRVPLGEDMMSLTERPGYLRLKGRDSVASLYYQSLIARRQQAFEYSASTCLEFEPDSFNQIAGLICIYNTENFYYLGVTHDEDLGKCIKVYIGDNGSYSILKGIEIPINGWDRIHLKAEVSYNRLFFSYSSDGNSNTRITKEFDSGRLSDEYCKGDSFTGAFVGISCHDTSGSRKHADFDYFEYNEG